MKILQIAAVDFTVKQFLLPLITSLKQEGHIVDIACNCGEISRQLERQGYRFHHIPFARNFNFLKHMTNIYRLVTLIKKEKYNCIHTHTPIASLIARIAGKIAGVPVIIYTVHGFYFHENMNSAVYKTFYLLEKIWSRFFTDYLFFVSQEDHYLAVQNNFKEANKLIYIGNGVSAGKFNPDLYNSIQLRRKWNFSKDAIVFIFVGRMVKEKGIIELIEAFAEINRYYPETRLLIVGDSVQGDRDSIDLKTLLNESYSKIKQKILLLGMREDIPELLATSDVFVLPSYREGLPISIIEAMAMKKPIIATNIRGCREEVKDGYNGYLCRVKNSSDLAYKMNLLLSKAGMIEVFGQRSREIFLKEYDEQNVIIKQVKLYRRISSGVSACTNT